MPFWTVIFLAARMTIPRDIYDAAEVDGATGIRRFIHVTFPMMANLYLICTLLSVLWTLRRLHDCLSRLGRRAGEFNASAGDPRFRLRLRGRQPGSRRRRGDVGAAGADPDRDHADAPVASERDPTMTAALADHATPLRRTRRRRQLRRTLAEAGSIILGIVLLIWSLLPVYNMLMIALDPEEGEIEFTGNIWPDRAVARWLSRGRDAGSPISRGVLASVRQQCLHRPVDSAVDCTDRVAGKLCGEPDAAEQGLAADQRGPAHLCDSGVLPDRPVLSDHERLRVLGQPMGCHRRAGDVRHPVRDPDLAAVWRG